MKSNNVIYGMLVILVVILLVGVFSPFIAEYLNNSMGTDISINSFDSNYLLTVISSVSTLAGVFFVIYGWDTIKELPNTIENTVNERLYKEIKRFDEKICAINEASQKMGAVYGIKDADQKISLLNDIIQLYPDTYNARITLGYVYWYDKKDYEKAERYFEEELRANPSNINAMCDLVALYDSIGENRNAIKYARQAIETDLSTKDYMLNDERLTEDLKRKIIEIN